VLCVKARNEVNTVLTHSVYSRIPLVEISQFLYTKLQVKIIRGNRQQMEKERTRKREKRGRESVQIQSVAASLLNLTVGQNLRSLNDR